MKLLAVLLLAVTGFAQKLDPIALADQSKDDPRILVMDYNQKDWSRANNKSVLWSWKPSDSGINDATSWTLPNDARLRNINGKRYMVTASGYGLIAVVGYPDKRKKWSINVGKASNVHGIELLPDGNVAMAASTGGWVRIYTASQAQDSAKYVQFDLKDAHNVLWDPSREVLWSLGMDKLVQLKIGGTSAAPTLTPAKTITMPDTSGHDLEAKLGDPNTLWITTGSATWSFDKRTEKFTLLQKVSGYKSINNQVSTGQRVQTRPHTSCTQNSWCTDIIEFFGPDDTRTREMAVYRARLWREDYQ